MVGQQRQQISKLQFFRTPQSFLCWNIRFKNQATTCSDFPSETVFWINEVENSWFVGRIEISAISLLKGFSKLQDAGREESFCSEEDHPEFPHQEEGQPRGTESPEKGPFSTRKLDAMFPCHDVFRFTDQASVGKSLLDGNKDQLLNQARSERFCETRTSSGISCHCIEELQHQACGQWLELQDAQHGNIEKEQSPLREQ